VTAVPIPFKTTLFWGVYRHIERPVLQQGADKVRAASNLRKRVMALPPARLITGGMARGVTVTGAEAILLDGTVLPLLVYRPSAPVDGPRPVVVNFHGGGWVSGDMRQSEWWASSVAARAGVVVVSVDYRLAPEFPFPVPMEDCYGATQWVADHAAELGVDATRLAVMGDSAGGNLAAAVSVAARDRGTPEIALQVLIYPSVELVEKFASEAENSTAPILGSRDVDNTAKLYFLNSDREMTDPYASPLRAKHEGLPPALIQTAQFDPLRDQGDAYADALREARVAVRLTNYVDAIHGYASLPGLVPVARQALAETVDTVRQYLAP
jgi:acetyl esterase